MRVKKKSLLRDFRKIMKEEIKEIGRLPFDDAESLTGKTSMGEPSLYKYSLLYRGGGERRIILKLKSSKVIANGIRLLNFKKDPKLYYLLFRHHKILSFDHSFDREIEFYKNIDGELREGLIPFLGAHKNKLKNRYMILMEEIVPVKYQRRDSVPMILDSILRFHIRYYGKEEAISRFRLNAYSDGDYKKSRPLLREMFLTFDAENRKMFSKEELSELSGFLRDIHRIRAGLFPHKTLTHNDFSPRNLFFDGERILIYDWELAAWQNPEHDLVELLVFVLHEFTDEEVRCLISDYEKKLSEGTGVTLSKKELQDIFLFNIKEYILNKLTVYRTASVTLTLDFIPDLLNNAVRLWRLFRRGEEDGK